MALNIPLCDDLDATDPTCMLFMAGLVVAFAPSIIVEAGTYKGHFAEMAQQLAPNARVFTADVLDHGYIPTSPQTALYRGDFEAMLAEAALWGIDVAFIDSGPPFPADSFEAGIRLRHYLAVKQRMVRGGIILTHDTNADDWVGVDTIRANATLVLHGGRGLTMEVVR